jgi:hypothetical protein
MLRVSSHIFNSRGILKLSALSSFQESIAKRLWFKVRQYVIGTRAKVWILSYSSIREGTVADLKYLEEVLKD